MIAVLRSAGVALSFAVGVSACGGNVYQGASTAVPQVSMGSPSADPLTVYPLKLALKGIGERNEKTFAVKELGYTGPFNTSETFGCMQAALLEPSIGKGPKTTFTLTGKKKTTTACTITFSDTKGHKANFTFTVA
jgi:hypothetical protein